MTPGITITLIICGTILILSIMSTITKIMSERRSEQIRMERISKTLRNLETPEDKDLFKKF